MRRYKATMQPPIENHRNRLAVGKNRGQLFLSSAGRACRPGHLTSLLGILNNFVSEPFGETYDLLAFPIGDRERLQCCAQMSAKSIPIRHRNGEVVMG